MKRLTLAMGILIALTGCQSTTEPGQANDVAQKEKTTYKQETKKTTTQVKTKKEKTSYTVYGQAKSNGEKWVNLLMHSQHLEVYSTELYANLLTAWNKAVELNAVIANDPAKANQSYSLFSSATYTEAYNQHLAEVAKQYDVIIKLKEHADPILAASIAQIDYLDQINASAFYADEYNALHDDYVALFDYVYAEKQGLVDDDDGALVIDIPTEQNDFIKKAKKFERKVAVAKYITPLQEEIANLKSDGSHQVAALSFAQAEEKIIVATKIVKQDPRASSVIEQAIADAEIELAHVRNIKNEVQSFADVENGDFEPVILELEGKLLSISKALTGSDLRAQPLQVQADLIVDAANKLHSDKTTDELEDKLAQLNAKIKELTRVNNTQASMLDQSKNKNESLYKELLRSKSETEAVQNKLDGYTQQYQHDDTTPSNTPMLQWSSKS